MRILLTGAAGQVGQEVVRQASAPGVEVVPTDVAELDITSLQAVEVAIARHRPQLVINAAAYTAVDRAESEDERALVFAVNRDGPAHLAQSCAVHGIPLFHISTDYVYDGSGQTPWRESDPTGPLGAHSQSKLEGDSAVIAALPAHLILRVSWVFSAHGQNFVKTMLRLGKEREELRVVADQVGGPTSASDIAAALLDLARRYHEQGTLPWGLYNFCGEPVTSWHGFAEEIFAQARQRTELKIRSVIPIATADYPTPARRPANSRLDTTLARTRLGLSIPDWRVSLNTVLHELIP